MGKVERSILMQEIQWVSQALILQIQICEYIHIVGYDYSEYIEEIELAIGYSFIK
jgi:hypothetical protein